MYYCMIIFFHCIKFIPLFFILSLEKNLNGLSLILDLMPAEDLKLLCKNFKVSYQSSKQKAVEALLKHSTSFKPIFGSKPTSSILLTK